MFYDFIISGGGLSGCLIGCVLKKLGLYFLIFDSAKQGRIDCRTSTISKASADFLDVLGIWQGLQRFTTPIVDIYTYKGECSSFLHFNNKKDDEKSPMGWMIPNEKLKGALQEKFANKIRNILHASLFFLR